MKISATLSHLGRLAVFIALAASAASCDDSFLFDEGEDCSVTYHLRFRYDLNMKYADAFSHEVTSVKLYAFDTDGHLVWQTTESGQQLAEEGYAVTLPLKPGDYRLLAWCGLGNGESFTVPTVAEDDTRESLHCHLNTTLHPEYGTISDKDLASLFHGAIDVSLPDEDNGYEYFYTMPLTKDTNVFRIVLQHLSGKDINVDDFTFRIEDTNSWLNHDNTLRSNDKVTYHAWSTYSGKAGVDITGSRAITEVNVAVAELTVSRLVMSDWSLRNKPMLTIRKAADGDLVARIPIIDYALLVKGNYNRNMTDQEYLDRQDEYNMTFFLDDQDNWLASSIIINSWRVVLNNEELD